MGQTPQGYFAAHRRLTHLNEDQMADLKERWRHQDRARLLPLLEAFNQEDHSNRPRYAAGEWSRRNVEALIADLRSELDANPYHPFR